MESPKKTPTIVVTGIGIVHGLGTGIEPFWQALLEGKSAIDRVTRFDTTEFSCQIGAEVKDFKPEDWMDRREANRTDRYAQFAIAASRLAMKDAGLDAATVDKDRIGVIIGSGIGGMETIETQAGNLIQKGPRKVSPFMIPSLIVNMASGLVAIEYGARGPNFSCVSACASGTHSIGEAFRCMQRGEADVMITGGAEAAVTALSYAGFCSMRAMATNYNDDPKRASRPFDKDRDGFIMGEGAGILILETLEHAKARGARIYAEIAGYSATCDAYHITSPDPEGRGLALCMRRTLESAGVRPEEVDYINAHGTSTPYNDKFETAAIKQVFGDHARKLKISSTKSMTGHLLGAAGGVEAAIAAKAIQTGMIPATINYETPDPDCDLDYVPNKAIAHPVKVAISDNLGFGGHNAAVLLRAIK